MDDPASITPLAPIAIVGISCRLPGGANSPENFWELLEKTGNAWTPVPEDRFNEKSFYHPSSDDPNGTNHHKGGHFIDADLRDFDHGFFRLSPQQAAAMDPQQRILLELSYEALEDAGWSLDSYAGSNMAVYAASFTADFERNLYRDPLNLPVYYLTGVEKAILSNRISHAFDFHGPSMTIDTACSGGLVAMHQACQSLRLGESDAAIVAASNLTMGPDQRIGMSKLHLIGDTGRCYPFDSRGNGYGRGEGCAVLVLKRLDKALLDRDPVRAIIRNTGVNQDGYTPASITYPNGAAQEQLIRETYGRVGLSPLDTVYVEAHGTGTKAGDFEEVTAISKAFSAAASIRPSPLYLGSVKGNIGHTENTSGLASIIKAVLMLNYLQIPGTAGLLELKSDLPVQGMLIPTSLTPWPHAQIGGSKKPPRVSINSFGFGGSNSHAILEQAPHQEAMRSTKPNASLFEAPLLFTLSANSEASLQSLIGKYCSWIEKNPSVSFEDLSYTLCHRRSILPWRFSCVAGGHRSLLNQLQARIDVPLIGPPDEPPTLVFVFTGQGAQWLGMARELLLDDTPCSIFRDSIQMSRNILLDLGADWDLKQELLRPVGETTRLNTAQLAQPVTTAVQLALVTLFQSFKILPQAVVGHSSGEIAAAYTAGHLSAREALTIAYHRGFMAEAAKGQGLAPGAMLSVGLGEDKAQPFLENLTRGNASIACVNSPQSVTISGDAAAVDEIASRITAFNASSDSAVFHRRLTVDTAYHSHHMFSVAEQYRSRLEDVRAEPAELGSNSNRIAFYSSVFGCLKSSGFGPEYWVENLVSPVRFSDAVQSLTTTLAGAQHNIFLEIGPHSSLAGPVRQCIPIADARKLSFEYLSVLQRKVDAVTSALTAAGRLFERGVDLNIAAVSALSRDAHRGVVLQNLPVYAWDHSQKHYFESRISREYRNRREPYHDLLGVRATDATSIEPRWRHMIGLNALPWLRHHLIDHQTVFPGSGYICMAIEALRQIHKEWYQDRILESIVLKNISFLRGLVVPDLPGERVEMQLSLAPKPGSLLSFQFRITAYWDGEWREHCTGVVEGIILDQDARSSRDNDSVQLAYLSSSVPSHLSSEATVIQPLEVYQQLNETGNNYGPTFATIRNYILEADMSSAIGKVKIPDTAAVMPAQHQQPHLIHPTTLDTVFHTCLPMVSHHLGRASIMPVHVDEIVVCATSTMLHKPSSMLDVSTIMKSTHHRTAYADVCATISGTPVLAVSGMELRSLASQLGNELSKGPSICYKLDWGADIDLLRAEDFSTESKLTQIFRSIAYKRPNMSILEIAAGQTDLALALLSSLDGPESTWPRYEYTSATSESLKKARERLVGYPVQYRTFVDEEDIISQGFQLNTYDAVLVSSLESLPQARSLLNSKGIVVAEIPGNELENFGPLMHEAGFDVQISVHDDIRGSSIILARPNMEKPTAKKYGRIRMLTHSQDGAVQQWVAEIEHLLEEGFGSICRVPIVHVDVDEQWNEESPTIIVDDLAEPILSDPHCFSVVVSLLKQPNRIIWLSPSKPLSMHQITGVARTAHAENEMLRLTTIHAALELLSGDAKCSQRLHNVLKFSLRFDGHHPEEREYQIDKTGRVLIPRLLHEDSLNRAIEGDALAYQESQPGPFLDASMTFILPREDQRQNSERDRPIKFLEINQPLVPGLNEVVIETRAFALTKAGLSESHFAYAGLVTEVGPAVKDLTEGDHVVAIGTVPGANRLVVPRSCVGTLAPGISFTTGAVAVIPAMEASHAVHGLAHLASGAKILVHGGLTALGRAAIGVARSIGATVSVSAGSSDEACRIIKELDVPSNLILRLARSQAPKNKDIGDVDLVVQASTEIIPPQMLAHLKPFGSIAILGVGPTPGQEPKMSTLSVPRNCTVFSCDIMELLRVSPESASHLVSQAASALVHLPFAGFDYCVRPVNQISEALRLVETGLVDSVVLQADKTSLAPVLSFPHITQSWWDAESASYLITGGLGDLGQRLLHLMAQRGAKHLVTLSRRSYSIEEKRKLQARLRTANPECILHCLTCDVTHNESVQTAARSLRELGIPPVRGIIHSAALLKDRTLGAMDHDDFLLGSRVKVDGTLQLEKAFTSPSLAFFLVLSSAVNVLGASGQANYNAGNSVVEAMATARQGRDCRYMSLSPGWIEDASFTVDDESRLNGLRRAGLRPISHDELDRFFHYALGIAEGKDRPAQVVIGFDSTSLANATTHNGTVHSPLFCHVRTPALSQGSGKLEQSSPENILSLAQAMANGDMDIVEDLVITAIVSHLARLISVDPNRIDPNKTSILDLGVDSLISIELRNWLMREFDTPLQTSEILIDQNVSSLAMKIVSRLQVASRASDNDSSIDGTIIATPRSIDSDTLSESAIVEPVLEVNAMVPLPSLPQPSLDSILDLFQRSRVAIDSADAQASTAESIRDFVASSGPSLHQVVAKMSETALVNSYEHQIYLKRREPLQDYSTFSLIHPVSAPSHSQIVRATVLTVAAIQFSRQLAAGTLAQDTLHGAPLDCRSREWLFNAIRRPGLKTDHMERFSESSYIVFLRRGHAFKMTFPKRGETLDPFSICWALEYILEVSEEPQPDISSFTADERSSWAAMRSELEHHHPENADALATIDRCAFVVCLDDEVPMTGGERHTQFLLNSGGSRLANRWFDKPFQLAVAGNGISAEVYEHTKLDGIDARQLHHALTQALFSELGEQLSSIGPASAPYQVDALKWKISEEAIRHINHIRLRGPLYGVLDHSVLRIGSLGSDLLRSRRVPPNSAAHLAVLLAMYMVDGEIRPAWEIVSLAPFSHGRIDWVQTVAPATKLFIEATAAAFSSSGDRSCTRDEKEQLKAMLDDAATAHNRLVSSAASGRGYVRHMYALLGAASESTDGGDAEIPSLFRSPAWNSTRRGGPGQDLKIGFMPTVGEQSEEWDEGGFLMEGERGVYIHCAVEEHHVKFSVSARSEYANLVCDALRRATRVISQVLA